MVESQELEFTNEIKSRAEANGGKLKYQTCTKAQEEVAAEEILSQKKVVEGLKSKYPGQGPALSTTWDQILNCLQVSPSTAFPSVTRALPQTMTMIFSPEP